MDLGNEMAIDAHCDACGILTKGGIISHIGICGFLMDSVNGGVGKYKNCTCAIPIDWSGGGGLMVETSSYTGEIQDAFRGFDTSLS